MAFYYFEVTIVNAQSSTISVGFCEARPMSLTLGNYKGAFLYNSASGKKLIDCENMQYGKSYSKLFSLVRVFFFFFLPLIKKQIIAG